MEPRALDYIDGDHVSLEGEPLNALAEQGLLSCYNHDGFWHSMDTLRDKVTLNELWRQQNPPWKNGDCLVPEIVIFGGQDSAKRSWISSHQPLTS